MNSYSLGIQLIRLLSRVPLSANALTALSRIWLRHFRWRSHLASFKFDVVIDGGANIGEFACVVHDTLPNVDLICIEPHPACAASLRRSGFKVIQAALWKEKTSLNLYQQGPATSCTFMGPSNGTKVGRVEAVPLSDVQISGVRLLIKLDLQGAELIAL